MSIIDDRYFKFPVKVYDQIELRIQERAEEKGYGEEYETPEEPWWVEGWCRLPESELNTLHWHEGFSSGQEKEKVEKKGGMDLTIVYSEKHGQLVCTWEMKFFEKKLEEFLERKAKELYIAEDKIEQSK